MNRLVFLLIILYSLQGNEVRAQRCGTDVVHKQLLETDEEYRRKRSLIMERLKENRLDESDRSQAVLYTIPVVFQVLYNNGPNDPTNISDAQILSQLDVINEDFRMLNADVSNVPSAFQGLVADVEIEFCLVSSDPSGQSTSGIVRTQVDSTTYVDMENAANDVDNGNGIWDRDSYLNIVILPDIIGTVIGIGFFPGSSSSIDAVYLDSKVVGTAPYNTHPAFGLGRTGTHEIGHWLNLGHIWGGALGCDDDFPGDPCSDSDGVADTPNQACANGGTPSYPLYDACTSSGSGILFMNYMDYVDDPAMIMFSNGQKARMRDALLNDRSEILLSNKCCMPNTIDVMTYNAGAKSYYKASSSILSLATVNSGASVIYQAGDSIKLEEGFNAKHDSYMKIGLNNCNSLIELDFH